MTRPSWPDSTPLGNAELAVVEPLKLTAAGIFPVVRNQAQSNTAVHPFSLERSSHVVLLLFFEFVWKAIWVLAFGLPLSLSGGLDPNVSFGGTETLIACLCSRGVHAPFRRRRY